MSDTFLRYLLILQEIPCAPRRTDSATLARALEERGLRVTRRTLQRDLEKLSRVLPLQCTDASKPFGWSWKQGASSPLPGLATPLDSRRPLLGEIVLATLDGWRALGDGRFEAGIAPFVAAHLRDALEAHTGLALSGAVVPLPQRPRGSWGAGSVDFALVSSDRQTAVLTRWRATPEPVGQSDGELERAALGLLGCPEARLRLVYVEPRPTPGRDSVGFMDFARSVERSGDAESRCFATYLRRWAELGSAPPAKVADVIPLVTRAQRG